MMTISLAHDVAFAPGPDPGARWYSNLMRAHRNAGSPA
jgi:hypothetical protein